MKKYFFYLLGSLLSLCANISFAQSDNAARFNGVNVLVVPYVLPGENFKSKLMSDGVLRHVISKIEDELSNRGFNTKSFEREITAAERAGVFNSQQDIKSSFVDFAQADLYIEVEVKASTGSGGTKVLVNLTANDAYDSHVYSKITCDSREMYSDDLETLSERALFQPVPPKKFSDDETRSKILCINDFLNTIQSKLTSEALTGLVNSAKTRRTKIDAESCQLYLAKADHEMLTNNYSTAIIMLLNLTPANINCYDAAQQKIVAIYIKQFGDLDKAALFYRKQVIIEPGNKIFWTHLNLLQKLINERNAKDNTPPQVKLTSPKADGNNVLHAILHRNQVFISGYAKNNSGVTSVIINGKVINELQPDGYFSTYIDGTATEIKIDAIDKKNQTTSKIYTLSLQQENTSDIPDLTTAKDEVYHAVFITNINYKNFPQLPTIEAEEKNLKEILTSKYSFQQQNITPLKDKSRRGIVSGLSAVLNSLTEKDNLIIYYAGHSEWDGKTVYLIPVDGAKQADTSWISNSQFDSLMMNCRAHHILVMADGCYSGGMRSAVSAPLGAEFLTDSRQVLASTKLGDTAPEVSIFNPSVCTALKSNTQPYLSAQDLQLLIRDNDNKKGINRLFPLIPMRLDSSDGGQFYFRMTVK